MLRAKNTVAFATVAALLLAGVGYVASPRREPSHAKLEAALVYGCERGCAKSGHPANECAARCDCVVHKLKENRSPDEFSAFIRADLSTRAQLRAEMKRASLACQSEPRETR